MVHMHHVTHYIWITELYRKLQNHENDCFKRVTLKLIHGCNSLNFDNTQHMECKSHCIKWMYYTVTNDIFFCFFKKKKMRSCWLCVSWNLLVSIYHLNVSVSPPTMTTQLNSAFSKWLYPYYRITNFNVSSRKLSISPQTWTSYSGMYRGFFYLLGNVWYWCIALKKKVTFVM